MPTLTILSDDVRKEREVHIYIYERLVAIMIVLMPYVVIELVGFLVVLCHR